MKKMILGMMVSAICLAASATEHKSTDKWNKGFKPRKASHKEHPTLGHLNNPGYTGKPQPNAPVKHSNPIPKKDANPKPEGTISSLGVLR